MSYHLFSKDERIARKKHVCIWCGQRIEPGEKYEDERSVYDGHIQRHRWHPECINAAQDWFKKEGEEFNAYENPRGGVEE
jgi:hypothetical protein